MVKIYTTYFSNVRNLSANIVPISISGKAPIGWKGLQYKKLAPKYSFFSIWKETQDNDYYIEHYNSEVLEKLSVDNVVNELITLAECSDTIALVCYESPEKFCHRHLVAKWLSQNGYEVEEYNKES
ncbi:MAG: DUF488 family protein [Clostridia bacterium]|nr:DUF488 family protein [Clostridia bacterium]